MLHERAVNGLTGLQHTSHHGGTGNTNTVIAKSNRSRASHGSHWSQSFSGSAHRSRTHHTHTSQSSFGSLQPNKIHKACKIQGRNGIRHARDGGESTSNRCLGTSSNGFLSLATWFSKMNMRIDQARTDDASTGINNARALLWQRRVTDACHAITSNQHISNGIQGSNRVDHSTASNQNGNRKIHGGDGNGAKKR